MARTGCKILALGFAGACLVGQPSALVMVVIGGLLATRRRRPA